MGVSCASQRVCVGGGGAKRGWLLRLVREDACCDRDRVEDLVDALPRFVGTMILSFLLCLFLCHYSYPLLHLRLPLTLRFCPCPCNSR